MYNTRELLNITICAATLTLILIGLFQTLIDRFMERWTRRFFIAAFTLLTAYISSILIYMVLIGRLGGSICSSAG